MAGRASASSLGTRACGTTNGLTGIQRPHRETAGISGLPCSLIYSSYKCLSRDCCVSFAVQELNIQSRAKRGTVSALTELTVWMETAINKLTNNTASLDFWLQQHSRDNNPKHACVYYLEMLVKLINVIV